MKAKVTLEELSKLSFIECKQFDSREIPLLPCFNENGEWELWLPGPSGLVRMQGGEPIEGKYFARTPVEQQDVYLEFCNFMLKRAYFPELISFIEGIMDDLHNLGASMEKLDVMHQYWLEGNTYISRRFVSTELEYIFQVCRSLFDLLQEMISRMWKRLKYFDEDQPKRTLPTSFAKIVLSGDTLLDAEDIVAKQKIPVELAKFYHHQGEFFQWLREYRSYILHSGKSFELIFITEQGFAIAIDQKPFSSLNIWNEKNTLPNNLGSVRSVVAHVILNTLKALEDFTLVIKDVIQFPEDISPNYEVFIRGHHTEILLKSNRYKEEYAWRT